MQRIVFEGIDGSGKSTQAEMFVEHLKKKGKEVLFLHEPRILRDEIFQAVKDIKEGKVTDAYLSYLFGKDGYLCRMEEHGKMAESELSGKFKEIDYIVRDRDTTISQYAYHHGFGTQDEMNYLMSWIINNINGVDKIVFINVPVKVAVERISLRVSKEKKLQQEYFEKEEKLKKVYDNYFSLFSDKEKMRLMGLDTVVVFVVNGCQSQEDLHKQIVECLEV